MDYKKIRILRNFAHCTHGAFIKDTYRVLKSDIADAFVESNLAIFEYEDTDANVKSKVAKKTRTKKVGGK